jgi:hypothetical protein
VHRRLITLIVPSIRDSSADGSISIVWIRLACRHGQSARGQGPFVRIVDQDRIAAVARSRASGP